VFDETGRPLPPETCVAMILDAYERASGHWYRSRGEPAGRTEGGVDFNSLGIRNRAGVISFEEFAESAPALFESYRFSARERVPFGERERFFATIMEHKRGFLPGDVIAIHGPKPDGYVHQHAILVADIDPLTGFPYLLADQMKATVYVAGAENDGSFTPEQAETLDKALTAAGVTHTVEFYPAAHGFAVPDNPPYDEEAAERHWIALQQVFASALPN